MNWITQTLLRLCVGGICCAAAITLAGAGAKREVTRFACTCIMLLICFSCVKNIDFNSEDFANEINLQDVADDALADRAVRQQKETDAALAQYIEEHAFAMGCICQIEVESKLEGGEYQVVLVTIGAADAQIFPDLENWLIDTLKLRKTQMRWEDTP